MDWMGAAGKPQKGVRPMSVFEALILAVAFTTLILTISKHNNNRPHR